jgi:aminopeptidase N
MNFRNMQRRRILIFMWLIINGFSNLSAQVRQFATDQLVEQEKNRYVSMFRSQADGQMQALASNNFDVQHYRCEWQVDPSVRYIKGAITCNFTALSATNSISFDLFDNLVVDSILYHQAAISFSRPGNNLLTINFPAAINGGARDSVSIYYQGTPTTSGFGSFTAAFHAGTPIIWTLSEPYGAREWWPCKNGLDDKTDSLDVIITTPDTYFATSNGILASETVSGGRRTVYWKHRYPIASYLVAFATTNYQVQNDTIQLKNAVLPLNQYVYPESSTTFANSMVFTKRTMRAYENAFGPYPFRNERYAHTQCGFGGGMEHQTNSFVGNATEALITHELGHQWFGDKVTCGSWQDIWLNEGFATFMANYALESFYSAATNRPTFQVQLNSIVSQPGGSVLVDDTTNVGRIFSYRLTYAKGAWLLRMLRWKLGDSAFYKGLRSYLTDPAITYGFARTDDLKRNLELSSGQDLDEFFRDWYNGQGYPSYTLEVKSIGGTYFSLSLSQSTSHPSVSFFEMPVPILFKGQGRDTLIVIDHKKNNQQLTVNLGFLPDTAIIDPDLQLISANNKVSLTTDIAGPPNTVRIFPNPVGDQFTMQLLNFTSSQIGITVHNAAGQLIWKQEKNLLNGSDYFTVESQKWSRGIYWLSIQSNDFKYVKKIMK